MRVNAELTNEPKICIEKKDDWLSFSPLEIEKIYEEAAYQLSNSFITSNQSVEILRSEIIELTLLFTNYLWDKVVEKSLKGPKIKVFIDSSHS